MLHRADWPIETAPLLFFDIETTGLRPDRGARITEIAVVGREEVRFYWEREQKGTGDALAVQLPRLFDHLRAGVVVGHNVRFDFRFVAYEADRRGLRGPTLCFIDTLGLARQHLRSTSNVRLSTLLSYFNIVPDGELHTALVDARATRALFWKPGDHGGLGALADAGLKHLNWMTF